MKLLTPGSVDLFIWIWMRQRSCIGFRGCWRKDKGEDYVGDIDDELEYTLIHIEFE